MKLWVRDEKYALEIESQSQSKIFESELHVQLASQEQFQDVKLPIDVAEQLKTLANKGIDVGELLREFLQNLEEEITKEKVEISVHAKPTQSRYIPKKVRTILTKEFGQKCAISNCKKPSRDIHHTQRFALGQIHNPHFMAPLCHEHHQIAHSIDQKFWKKLKP